MVEKKFSVYLGNNTEAISAGFDVEGSFLCVLEIGNEEGSAETVLRETLEELRSSVRSQHFTTLHEFSSYIRVFVDNHNILSLAALYLRDDSLYGFCHHAQIQLKRTGEWYSVAQGNQQATGSICKDDAVFLSTTALEKIFDPSQLPESLTDPKEITDFVNEYVGSRKSIPAAGMVVVLDPKTIQTVNVPVQENPRELGSGVELPREKVSLWQWIKRARIPLFLLVVGVIGWKTITQIQSIIHAQREKTFTQKMSAYMPEIERLQKLVFLNTADAKKAETLTTDVEKLLKDFPDKKNQIQPLLSRLTGMEKTLGTTHISKESLFFDLRLIDQKAKADSMALSSSAVCILDNTSGKAYVITIDTKRQDSYTVPDAQNARLIGCTGEQVYVFNNSKGVMQLTASGSKNIVPGDKQWGSIYQMQLFNSNVYLLDGKKDEIFKYIPIENGYSDALSYFQSGNSMDLGSAKSFAIDFSIYILTDSGVSKYTGGVRDSFSLKTETVVPRLSQLYKDTESDFLYALSNAESRVVAIDKNGAIKKSIFNPKLKDVKYFGVNKDKKILFLYGNSIYVLDNF